MVGGATSSLLPDILGQIDRIGAKSPIYEPIFARSASSVTLSEKKFSSVTINTNKKSTTRFRMSLDGGTKRKTAVSV